MGFIEKSLSNAIQLYLLYTLTGLQVISWPTTLLLIGLATLVYNLLSVESKGV